MIDAVPSTQEQVALVLLAWGFIAHKQVGVGFAARARWAMHDALTHVLDATVRDGRASVAETEELLRIVRAGDVSIDALACVHRVAAGVSDSDLLEAQQLYLTEIAAESAAWHLASRVIAQASSTPPAERQP